jgi:glutathione S-transferase
VLHVGERSEALLPRDARGRARAIQWVIAALNTIEPFVLNVAMIDFLYSNEEWAELRRPSAVEFLKRRLSSLAKSLGDRCAAQGVRAGGVMHAAPS